MAAAEIWVEKHRPKTVDEYVFKDPKQEAIIKGWVADKSIPHLLLHGGPGTGKCLGPEELLEVRIDESSLSPSQLLKLAEFKKSV